MGRLRIPSDVGLSSSKVKMVQKRKAGPNASCKIDDGRGKKEEDGSKF